MFPCKQKFKDKGPLCQLSAAWLNRVQNMLDDLMVVTFPSAGEADSAAARIQSPKRDGTGWKIEIPIPTTSASDLPVHPETGSHVLVAVENVLSWMAAPASGNYVLMAQGGSLSWVALEEFTCPEV